MCVAGLPQSFQPLSSMSHWHRRPEPGAAHNEGRVILAGDSDVMLAALMCELDRYAPRRYTQRSHFGHCLPQHAVVSPGPSSSHVQYLRFVVMRCPHLQVAFHLFLRFMVVVFLRFLGSASRCHRWPGLCRRRCIPSTSQVRRPCLDREACRQRPAHNQTVQPMSFPPFALGWPL